MGCNKYGCSAGLGVLGPLLFCLYINDVKNLFTQDIGHVLHADDLQVYIRVPHDEIENGIARLSEVARAAQNWAKGAGLCLNPGKTQAIIFPSVHVTNTFNRMELHELELGNGVVVPFSNKVTSLGVVFDRSLTWKPHINSVTNKVN